MVIMGDVETLYYLSKFGICSWLNMILWLRATNLNELKNVPLHAYIQAGDRDRNITFSNARIT